MRFSFASSFTLLASLTSVFADSEKFILTLDASGTDIDGFYAYASSDGRLYASPSGSIVGSDYTEVYILTNTSLSITDIDTVVGVGRNYLSWMPFSNQWVVAEPFTIVDGYLKLFGLDFRAVPDTNDDGNYVIGSGNAASKRTDAFDIKIKALKSDGSLIETYPSSESSSDGTTTSDATTSDVTTSDATTSTTSETTTSETTTSETSDSTTSETTSETTSTATNSTTSEPTSETTDESTSETSSTTSSNTAAVTTTEITSSKTSSGSISYSTDVTSTVSSSSIASVTFETYSNAGSKYEVAGSSLLFAIAYFLL